MAAYTTIDDPSAHFQIALHTSANSVTITNDGNSDLQPDFIWSKARGQAYNHGLYDSTRGVTKFLSSNTTSAETTASSGYDLTSFNTDGFSTGNNQYNTICGGTTYVAWQWKANGGTTSTNNDGSLTSTVQVNTTAGFSIVTYAGASATNTVGHGLGVAPKVVLVRARDKNVPTSWIMFHKDGSTSDDDYMILQGTFAKNSQAGLWNNQYPSSTTFGIANDFWVSQSGYNYVAYCFAEVQGYSKFGSYIGNSNDDGTFVYLGFKPRWLMIKSTQSGMSWDIIDTARSTSNVMDDYLTANTSDPQGTSSTKNIDFLSNGFKCRDDNNINFSDHTYIYMAFAEHPFVTSGGIPTTAR